MDNVQFLLDIDKLIFDLENYIPREYDVDDMFQIGYSMAEFEIKKEIALKLKNIILENGRKNGRSN